jgi:hypothetical protein
MPAEQRAKKTSDALDRARRALKLAQGERASNAAIARGCEALEKLVATF